MDLLNLFDNDVIQDAKKLYNKNQVTVIKKDKHHIEAIVFDDYYYKVEFTFNENYNIVWPRVSRDGFRDICPFTKPYAAAVLYKLYLDHEYGITYNFNHTSLPKEKNDEFQFMSNPILANMGCYRELLSTLTKHILRIQNYNTDDVIATFSDSIDDLFEFFDSIIVPKEKLVALQLFLHIYKHLKFDFNIAEDIEIAIIEECNLRIHEVLQNEVHPTSRFYYQSILLNDYKIASYIYDYNKSSQIPH